MNTIREEPIYALSNQLILDKLAQCNCCQKHQIDKPKLYLKWIDTTYNKGLNPLTSNTNHITGELYCKCDCRHTARMICRNCS
jgi:hypothetical protein